MKNLRTIEDVEKEFDNFMIDKYGKWKVGRKEAKQFISSSLRELLEQVVPEEKSNPIDSKFLETDEAMNFGFNTCRQQTLDHIKKILE